MAAPRDLPIRPLISDQPLQTPDTSALFLPSSSASPLITPVSSTAAMAGVGFTSLEELLDASGINNLDMAALASGDVSQPHSRKRVCSELVDLGNSFSVKNPHLENNSGSSQLTSGPGSLSRLDNNNILAQVASSGMVTIPSIVASVSRGPPLLPAARPSSSTSPFLGNLNPVGSTMPQPPVSSSSHALPPQQQHQQPALVTSTAERKFVSCPSSSGTMVTSSLPLTSTGVASLFSQPSAAGTVAMLVQQFKQAQASGDLSSMDSIRHKLLLLHQQLAARAVSSGLAQNSLPNSVSPAATTTSISSTTGLTSTGIIPDRTNLFPANVLPNTSNNRNTANTALCSANSIGHGPIQTVPSSHTTISPSAVLPKVASSQGRSFSSNTLPLTTTSLSSTVSLTESVSSSSVHYPVSSASSLSTNFSGSRNLESNKVPDLPVIPVSQVSSLTDSLPASNLVSPSIVTQMATTPSLNSSAIRPQGAGLHVTAQTQANVLRAVYGYRLRQIQDFLAALPADQRPSSTQELREMLKQNNVLSKGLPPSFLAQLQHQEKPPNLAPPTTNVPINSIPASVSAGATVPNCVPPAPVPSHSKQGLPHNLSTTTPAVQLPANNSLSVTKSVPSQRSLSSATASQSSAFSGAIASSTSSVTTSSVQSTPASSQPPVVLPGVTMETLRTLCRLPEADVSRIPMHPMLQAVVHYLRTAKWVGNKTELPHLLQKAQEAIGKGTLVQPLSQPVTTNVQTVGSVLQQLSSASSSSSSSSSPSSSSSSSLPPISDSPLAQYMAKVGAKIPPATDSSLRKDRPYVPSSRVSLPQQTNSRPSGIRPLTRYQHRIQQEKVEQERLQALQKALQSSEEARIAFRFQAHMEKLHQQLLSPEVARPFSSWQEVALRLIPYHVYSEPELPQGAMEKAEAVYEGIAGVLQSKAQGMMSRFEQIFDQESKNDGVMKLVVDKLWIEGEKERKEEEERQRLEAEQVAQELSAMSDPLSDQLSVMSPESDPLLSNYWTSHDSSDFFSGIT